MAPKSKPKPVADQLRKAIAQAGRQGITRYKIAQDTGIAQSTLTQFVNGKGQLRLDIAEKIAAACGGRLTLDI